MSLDAWHDACAGRLSDCSAVWVGPVLCFYPKNDTEFGAALVRAAIERNPQ